MPVSFDADGNPSYPAWSTDQKDALYNLLKSFDPTKVGLDRAFLKQLNKGVGTNDLQMGLDALIAEGRIESRRESMPGTIIKVEKFFWKGA
jgi:hypothetical protein